MRQLKFLIPLLLLAGCQKEATEAPPVAAPETIVKAPIDPTFPHTFDPAIRATDFAAHVKHLSSDTFEGRAPGSLGERMTTTYLKSEFERMGLKPGNNGSFFQSVPMVKTTLDPATFLRVEVDGKKQILKFGKDVVVGTRQAQPSVSVRDAEIVFVGYGVNAPEFGWNDYEGVDVKGKVVLVMVNDPGFIRKDPELFKGTAMTYYGRWTYKFEEAARQGAAGALVIHESEAASYGWEVVQSSWGGAQFDLPPSEDPSPRLQMEGWISAESNAALFTAAGQDFAALRMAADQRGFKAVELPAKASVNLRSTIENAASDNVVAMVEGSSKPDEAILYVAHWDHLGLHKDEAGDNIYNGAVDNATGVASLLELAEAFAKQDPKPSRSVVFVAVTLEESGLLGSKHFAAHSPIPLAKIQAVINMDALAMAGASNDVSVMGFGQSNLDDVLSEVLKAQNRVAVPEPTPEKGFYFRSDHFNFAKAGVPALYAKAGIDLRNGGIEAGRAAAEDYTKNRYHKPADEFNPNWDYDGVIEDVNMYYQIGQRLSEATERPRWSDTSEFKAAQDKLLGEVSK